MTPVPKPLPRHKKTPLEQQRAFNRTKTRGAVKYFKKRYIEMIEDFDVREEVRERDNYKCVACGADYSKMPKEIARIFLAVHHVKKRKNGLRRVTRWMVSTCSRFTEKQCHCNADKYEEVFIDYLAKIYGDEIIEF